MQRRPMRKENNSIFTVLNQIIFYFNVILPEPAPLDTDPHETQPEASPDFISTHQRRPCELWNTMRSLFLMPIISQQFIQLNKNKDIFIFLSIVKLLTEQPSFGRFNSTIACPSIYKRYKSVPSHFFLVMLLPYDMERHGNMIFIQPVRPFTHSTSWLWNNRLLSLSLPRKSFYRAIYFITRKFSCYTSIYFVSSMLTKGRC